MNHSPGSEAGVARWTWILLAAILLVAAGAATWSRSDVGNASRRARNQGEPVATDLRAIVGIEHAEKQLGAQTPTGRGITFGHVEGRIEGGYLPRHQAGVFDGVTFNIRSQPGLYSGHADATARLIYGPSGLAPGVSQVNLYAADDWMGDRCLRLLQSEPPTSDGCRIFTHSWISGGNAADEQVLGHLDFMIDTYDVIVVCGVNNGGNSPVPGLLAGSYNAISVGTVGGNSSGGYTKGENAGRCKPDLVVDVKRTSFATPVVAAITGRLLEAADNIAAGAKEDEASSRKFANRAEVIKAVLLLKGPIAPTPADGEPAKVSTPIGWDFATLPVDQNVAYAFEIADPLKELAIAVTWHRRGARATVEDTKTKQKEHQVISLVADFDLRLVYTAGGQTSILARSTSGVDNVEFIRLYDVQPGVYRIDVRQKPRPQVRGAWDVAVAWWSTR